MTKKQFLLNKLEEISKVVENNYENIQEIGVLQGSSGVALFQFYYAKLIGQESHTDLGATIITSIFERLNKGYNTPTFCSGIAGAAWTIELLHEEGFIDLDCDELLSGFDNFLINSITILEKDQNFFDFLHGVLGIGIYFLKRFQNTQSNSHRELYKTQLLAIITLLKKTSLQDTQGIKWESYLIRDEGITGYNLSFAHGITSIVNFLSRLVVYPDFKLQVTALLHPSINYIRSLKIQDSTKSFSFPSWITSNNIKSKTSRLAWCYGDLGIALTLYKAGESLNYSKYKEEAVQIFKHASKRKNLEEAGVKDAGLCHGAYGIMHIYQHIYTKTGEPTFKQAQNFWLEEAIHMAIHEPEYAGYKKWCGGENSGWESEINLLAGITGIGLSIISYLAPFDTKWDECLLIS